MEAIFRTISVRLERITLKSDIETLVNAKGIGIVVVLSRTIVLIFFQRVIKGIARKGVNFQGEIIAILVRKDIQKDI